MSPESAALESESACEENFHDAQCPEGGTAVESEWTTGYDLVVDEDTFVAQITGGAKGEAYLFVNGQIFDGVQNEAGKWVFTLTDLTELDTFEEHDSGYVSGHYEKTTRTLKIIVEQDGETMAGSLQETWQSTDTWYESDEWDENETGVWYSEVPSGTYLTGDKTSSRFDEDDCEGSSCELTVTTASRWTIPVRAQLTEAFEGVDGYGDWAWDDAATLSE